MKYDMVLNAIHDLKWQQSNDKTPESLHASIFEILRKEEKINRKAHFFGILK
jgi:hypothetical protein